MKAALFTGASYSGARHPRQMASPGQRVFSPGGRGLDAVGTRAVQHSRRPRVRLGHCCRAPLLAVFLTPNPMVMAGALTQRVRRANVLLGPNIPIQNPVRVAEEFAMLDTLTDGRVVAGMLRGTSNEYVTYNINPAESRGRFDEALQIIRRAWSEPQPFGWWGSYYEYRSISIWPRPVQQPQPPMYMSRSSKSRLFGFRSSWQRVETVTPSNSFARVSRTPSMMS